MKTMLENNLLIESLADGIEHLVLNGGHQLSTHVIRQLDISAKIKDPLNPQTYIISVNEPEKINAELCRVCFKSAKFSSSNKVAVVCKKPCERKTQLDLLNPNEKATSSMLFNEFDHALNWATSNKKSGL